MGASKQRFDKRDDKTLAVNSQGHVFAGTEFGGIFRSTDNGESWMEVNSGLSDYYVLSLAINARGHIFAGTGGRIFRSTDNGGSWTLVNNVSCHSLVINSRGHIFAGGFGKGVFRSTDNGESWTAINSGLPIPFVLSLALDPAGYILAGTDRGGVFRSVEITTAVNEFAGEMPKAFSLEQNYPNPCNPSTTIQFSLPRSGYVTLKVYNTLGEEVATLVEENRTAGRHQVAWHTLDIPNSAYFYRLQAGGLVQTKKLTVLK